MFLQRQKVGKKNSFSFMSAKVWAGRGFADMLVFMKQKTTFLGGEEYGAPQTPVISGKYVQIHFFILNY